MSDTQAKIIATLLKIEYGQRFAKRGYDPEQTEHRINAIVQQHRGHIRIDLHLLRRVGIVRRF